MAGKPISMDVTFGLCLPRDGYSVSLVRRICADTFARLGVTGACSHDIQIALTEACTNVLKHARDDSNYEVVVAITESDCKIKVIDGGDGFDPTGIGFATAPPDAEQGRGLHLLTAVVDEVTYESRPQAGTTVCFIKRLQLEQDSPLMRLRGISISAHG